MFEKKLLIIEIGDSLIKVCQISKRTHNKKNPVCLHEGFLLVTPQGAVADGQILNTEALAQVLEPALEAHGIRQREVIFSLLSGKVATRDVHMPPVKETRIKAVVDMNAGDYFPVDISKYQFSHALINTVPKGEDAHNQVLVMAAPKSLLEGYFELASLLGLQITTIDYSGNSIFRILEQITDEGVTVYVDMDADTSIITVMDGGRLVMQRFSPCGGNELALAYLSATGGDETEDYLRAYQELCGPEGEQNLAKLDETEIADCLSRVISNATRSVDYYNSNNWERPAEKLVITGLCAVLPGLENLLEESVKLPTTVLTELPGAELMAGGSLGNSLLGHAMPARGKGKGKSGAKAKAGKGSRKGLFGRQSQPKEEDTASTKAEEAEEKTRAKAEAAEAKANAKAQAAEAKTTAKAEAAEVKANAKAEALAAKAEAATAKANAKAEEAAAKAKAKAQAAAKAEEQAKAKAREKEVEKAEAAEAAKAEAEAIALAEAAVREEILAGAETEARALAQTAEAEKEAAIAAARETAEKTIQSRRSLDRLLRRPQQPQAEAEIKQKTLGKALEKAQAKAKAREAAAAKNREKAIAAAQAKVRAEIKAKTAAQAKEKAQARAAERAAEQAREKALEKEAAQAEFEAKALAKENAKAQAKAEAEAKALTKEDAKARAKAEAEAKEILKAQAKEKTREESAAKAQAKADAKLQAKLQAKAPAKVPTEAAAESGRHWSSAGYLHCMGSAFSPADFVPEEMQKKKGKQGAENSYRLGFLTIIAAAVLGLILSATAFLNANMAQQDLENMNREIARLEHTEAVYLEYSAYRGAVTGLEEFAALAESPNHYLVDFFRELEEKMPTEIRLLSAVCTTTGVNMNVTVGTKPAAAEVIIQLRSFESLASVEVVGIAESVDETGLPMVAFNVNCSYPIPEEEEVVPAPAPAGETAEAAPEQAQEEVAQ